MAYRPQPDMKPIVKDYAHVRITITEDKGQALISIEAIPDMLIDAEEKHGFDVFKVCIENKREISYEDASRLLHERGYKGKLVSNIFTDFDAKLTKDSLGEFRLLPGLKETIEGALGEYVKRKRGKENIKPAFSSLKVS